MNEQNSANNTPRQQDPFGSNGRKPDKKRRFNIYWVYGILAAVIILAQFFWNDTPQQKKIDLGELIELLQKEEVEKIEVVNKKTANIYLNDKGRSHSQVEDAPLKPSYTYNIGSLERFEQTVQEVQGEAKNPVYPTFEENSSWGMEILSWVLPLVLLMLFWVFIMRRMTPGGGGQIFNIGKSKAQLFDKDSTQVNVTFKDVAGLEEAKVEIMEIVDFLKNPDKYTKLGGKIPKGALLVGPPGTGKTLLAKSVAGEANVPFFSISGSDFVEMFVGVGASRVRDLFRQAKEKAPCIVFIDEIDAVGRARGKNVNMGGNDERESTLNQLLTEMDGFGSNSGVIILAATNRADILDKALLRAGRFDRQIYVELPELSDRKEIFQVHLRDVKTDGSVDLDQLSRQTPGFSGADIANVCNEAALIAARRKKKAVQRQDFNDAIDRIVGGLEKRSKVITDEERRSIAVHEAGHATVSWHLRYGDPLIKVTIVPRGKALGAAWYMPEERQIEPKQALLDKICSLMAGRVAEDIFLGFIDTGALNDLERATKIAYAMVTYYGMSDKLPNISYYDSSSDAYGFTKPYSEDRAQTIDQEVQAIIDSQYARAREILTQYTQGHHELAELLQQREVIFTEDAERIFGPRQWKSRTEEILKEKENSDASDHPDHDGQPASEPETESPSSLSDTPATPPPFNK